MSLQALLERLRLEELAAEETETSRSEWQSGRGATHNPEVVRRPAQKLMDEKTRKALAADKNGVAISLARGYSFAADSDKVEGIVDFGSQNVGERSSATLRIAYAENDTTTMTGCELLDNSVAFLVETVATSRHNSSYDMKVVYSSNDVGNHKSPLVLRFQNEDGENYFEIWRFLNGQTKNEEMDEIMPTAPYTAFDPLRFARDPSIHIVRGVQPNSLSKGIIKVPLADYKLPRELQAAGKYVRIPAS